MCPAFVCRCAARTFSRRLSCTSRLRVSYVQAKGCVRASTHFNGLATARRQKQDAFAFMAQQASSVVASVRCVTHDGRTVPCPDGDQEPTAHEWTKQDGSEFAHLVLSSFHRRASTSINEKEEDDKIPLRHFLRKLQTDLDKERASEPSSGRLRRLLPPHQYRWKRGSEATRPGLLTLIGFASSVRVLPFPPHTWGYLLV